MLSKSERLLIVGAIFVASLPNCNDNSPPLYESENLNEIPIPNVEPTAFIPIPTASPAPTRTFSQDTIYATVTPSPDSRLFLDDSNETRNTLKFRTVDWKSLNLNDLENVKRWESYILDNANKYNIPPEIIAVIIDSESHGRTDGEWAENPGDGVGLMGVMPEELGFPKRPTREELFDPQTNIDWGTSILWEIYHNPNLGNEDWYYTFLWYNAGLPETLKYAVPYADNVFYKLGWEIPYEDILNYPYDSYLE